MRAKKVHLLCTAAFSLVIFPGLADAKSRDLYYSRIKPWLENASREPEAITESRVVPLHFAQEGEATSYQKPLPWLKKQNAARGLPAGYVPSYLKGSEKQTDVAATIAEPRPVPLMKAPQEIARNPEPEYIEEDQRIARTEENPTPDETPRPILLRHRDDVIAKPQAEEVSVAEAPITVQLNPEEFSEEEIAVEEPASTTQQAVPTDVITSQTLEEPKITAPQPGTITIEEKQADVPGTPAVIKVEAPAPAEAVTIEPAPIAVKEEVVKPTPVEAPHVSLEPDEATMPVAAMQETPRKILLKHRDQAEAPVTVSVEPVVPAQETSALQENQKEAESALYPEKKDENSSDADGDFDTASNVPAHELGEIRGGFMTSNGMQIDIGLETRTLVNGAVAEQTLIKNIENLKKADLQNLVQVNNANANARKLNLSDVPNIMTVIQNSRNDVKVDSFAIMNIDVSNSARFQLQTQAPDMFNVQAINNLR